VWLDDADEGMAQYSARSVPTPTSGSFVKAS
jgi:hypothetical protein